MMLGAASYLLAVVLFGFGGAKLFHAKLRVMPRVGWIALFIISGACLLQLQTQHLQGWRALFNIQGPGGWLGYFIGKKLLLTWMGGVGSILLLSGIYVSSLILMTGLRPIHIVRQGVASVRNGIVALREWQLKRKLRRSDLKERLEISQQELANAVGTVREVVVRVLRDLRQDGVVRTERDRIVLLEPARLIQEQGWNQGS
jgi:biotin operon repressor